MGTVLSTISSWLQAGYERAINCLKWIWESAISLLSDTTEFIQNVLAEFFSYTRDRLWVQSGTTRTEVGCDSLRIGAVRTTQPAPQLSLDPLIAPQLPPDPVATPQLSSDSVAPPQLPSDPVACGQKLDQMLEGVAPLEAVCGDVQRMIAQLKEIRAQHDKNPQETERNLQGWLENEQCVKNVRAHLNKQASVPPSLV